MPAVVSAAGISTSQTSPGHCPCGFDFAEAAQKKLKVLGRNPRVDLWAGDEVHFQQFGSRCRMWIPPEVVDPILWHHPTRQSVGYFGAVRWHDGKMVYQREEGRFNKESYFRFLQHLRRSASRSDRRVVVIVDNASYHHARLHKPWRESHRTDFQLYFLPPYSPELNPIERVWKLTRRKCLHNQYFSQLNQVTETVEKQFQLWNKANSTLHQLCAIT